MSDEQRRVKYARALAEHDFERMGVDLALLTEDHPFWEIYLQSADAAIRVADEELRLAKKSKRRVQHRSRKDFEFADEVSPAGEMIRAASKAFPNATNQQLMDALGVSRSTVQRYRPLRETWSSQKIDLPWEEIKLEVERGKSFRSLAVEYGVSARTLSRRLREFTSEERRAGQAEG